MSDLDWLKKAMQRAVKRGATEEAAAFHRIASELERLRRDSDKYQLFKRLVRDIIEEVRDIVTED